MLGCGALPVTRSPTSLKPGGVARMTQWLAHVEAAMRDRGASTLADLSRDSLANVRAAADEAARHPRYRKPAFPHGLQKVKSALGALGLRGRAVYGGLRRRAGRAGIHLARHQASTTARSDGILARNPLPGVTGYVCTRLCQTKCTRNDYDESVAIRALKRVAGERGRANYASALRDPTGRAVAIVGTGPSGLAAAAFLALNGVRATIFEKRDVPGGMMRVVPPFRLPWEIVRRDIDRILALGVELRLNAPVDGPPEQLLGQGFDAVYLASGFQRDAPLRVPRGRCNGVIPALRDCFDRSRRGEPIDLGHSVVVIGGGDTAMDAVRTAQRVTGRPVTLLYRRTRQEMPADEEELDGALKRIVLMELVTPVGIAGRAIASSASAASGIRWARPTGRRSPAAVARAAELAVACDSVVRRRRRAAGARVPRWRPA